MSPSELHRLDTYANVTHGRPLNSAQCIACGTPVTLRSSEGFCWRCERKLVAPDLVLVKGNAHGA